VRRNLILGTLALVFLTILAYWPVLNGSSGFIWDDDGHVTANTALHDATGLASIWTWGPHAFFNHSVKPATQQYYPATFTSFWIEYQLWQNQPTGYHITNVALHLISSLLLWRILQRLGLSPGISFFAAALFAVHPVNVESVAWVSERKNTLSLVFYLLAALCWLRWANISKPAQPVGPAPTRDAPSPLWLVLATALFLLALLAKSVTASLPAALMVILWWKRGRISRRELLGLLPLFLLALASAALTISIEHTPGYIGASGPDFNLSFSARCIIAGRALLFYIAKLLLPIHLLFRSSPPMPCNGSPRPSSSPHSSCSLPCANPSAARPSRSPSSSSSPSSPRSVSSTFIRCSFPLSPTTSNTLPRLRVAPPLRPSLRYSPAGSTSAP